MSDQPEIVNLGVEDDGSLESVLAKFLQGMETLSSGAEASFSAAQESAQQFIDTVDTLANAFRDDAIQTEIDRMVQLEQSTRSADDAMRQAAEDAQTLNTTLAASGGAGAADTGADDGSGGGGGVGSLFGVAHGIRAASGLGRMAGLGTGGTEALTGVADLLYLEQGLSKLSDILPAVGTAVGGLIESAGGAAAVFPALGLAIAAVSAVVIVATAAHAEYEQELKTGKEQLGAALSAQEQYYVDVHKLTTDQAKTELTAKQSDLAAQQDIEKERLSQIREQALSDNLHLSVPLRTLAAKETDQELANDPALRQVEGLKELYDAYDKTKSKTDELADVTTRLGQGLDAGAFKANDAAQALKDHDQAVIDGADKLVALHRQEVTDLQGTSDTVQKRLDGLQGEKAGLQENIDVLKASGDTSDAVSKKINDLQNSLVVVNDRIQNINDGLPAIKAEEQQTKATTEAIKEANRVNAEHESMIKRIIAAQDAYDKAIQKSLETFTNSANDLALKEKVSEQQYQPGSTQDTFARQTIALKEQTDVAKIEEDTANKIEDIRTKLGETEARIITDYNRQLFDDQIKAQDGIQKAQIDAQRTAVEDQISYQERIADIERSAHINEQQALLDRNFLQITKDELNKNNQIQTETDHYSDQEEKLQRHLANQEQDIQRNLEITEAQQQTAEQRKLADAETAADNSITQEQTTEKRKIEVAQDAQQKALADLSRNEIEKLTLMRESWYQQWSMLGLQENQREQLAAQTEQQIVSQNEQILAAGTNAFIDDLNRLNAIASGSSGGSSVPAPSMWQTLNGGGDIATFAGGGDFQAGQPFMMSEAGIPEFLNIGSDSFAMNAPALVYPLASGSVTNAGGGGGKNITYAPTYNIPQGMKTPDIVSLIEQHNAAFMQELTR